MRKVIALTAAAGLLLTLAGCTVSAPSGACEPAGPGEASDLVSVKGEFGEQPTVDFPTPLNADKLEVNVLDKGDGKTVHEGDFVDFTFTVFDPETGEQANDTSTASIVTTRKNDAERLFECLTIGSRAVALLPGSEEDGTKTAIIVVDVQGAYPAKATGRIEIPQQGMPSVVTAPNGQPGVTILNEAPPTSLEYSTLITGDGKKVAAGDTVRLQFTVLNWDSKSVLTTTWGQAPQTRLVSKFDAQTGDGVSAGSLAALTGATVGSQVLVVLPPSTWANSDIQAPEGATLVVVYDILAIV